METPLVGRGVEWNDTVRDKRHRHTVARSATSRSSASPARALASRCTTAGPTNVSVTRETLADSPSASSTTRPVDASGAGDGSWAGLRRDAFETLDASPSRRVGEKENLAGVGWPSASRAGLT